MKGIISFEPAWKPTNLEYHENPALSPSRINGYISSPRGSAPDAPDEEEYNLSFVLGSLVNQLVLEPLSPGFHVVESGRNTKAFENAEAAWKLTGKMVVTRKEADRAAAIAQAILAPKSKSAEAARALLTGEGGWSEWAHQWVDKDTGLDCKMMLDRVNMVRNWPAGSDLKTSRDPSPAAFRKAIFEYGYHRQAAWNCEGFHNKTGVRFSKFFWVVVGNSYPYEVNVMEAAPSTLEVGHRENQRARRQILEQVKFRNWEKLESGEFEKVEPPPYYNEWNGH